MQQISLTHYPVSSGATLLVTLAILAGAAPAQARHASTGAAVTSTTTLAAQLQQVLPADVAARILARVAAADSAGLPGKALAQRALKFAARGVVAAAIEQSVDAQVGRMAHARQALNVHAHHATSDEIEAGAEAMRQGVSGQLVSALAKSAPSGRSLAVSLYVIGSLTARGLPADQALARVETRLTAHASDEDVESLLSTVAQGRGDHGGGHDAASSGTRGGNGVGVGVGVGAGASVGAGAGGPPANVPANGGTTVRPPTLPIGTHTRH